MIRNRGRIGLLVAALCLGFLVLPIRAQATDYYVDAVSGSNGNGGLSQGDAWKTITYALSQVSGTGHTIHVAQGTYNTALGETFPLNMENGVSLLGAGAANTIVDAGGTNVVINANNIGASTTLDGFTITNGSGGWYGGGIHNSGSSWTVSNCTITNNEGTEGGGILFENGDSSTVTNCTISYNSLSSSPPADPYEGLPYKGGGINMYFNSGTYNVSEFVFPLMLEVQASFWGLRLDTLSVLAYEKTGGMQDEHITREHGP